MLLSLQNADVSPEAPSPQFKLVIIGDECVGKTTFIQRFKNGEHERRYIPRHCAEVRPVTFHTSRGPIVANCWDTAGQERFGNLREDFYFRGQAAIIMFDVNSRLTYQNVPTWHRDLTRVCGDIPIVLVGNKVDAQNRQVKPKQITFHHRKKLQYYDVSAKANFNIEKPFLYLLRKVFGDAELSFVGELALYPPELEIDLAQMQIYQQQLDEANAVPVPEDIDLDDL